MTTTTQTPEVQKIKHGYLVKGKHDFPEAIAAIEEQEGKLRVQARQIKLFETGVYRWTGRWGNGLDLYEATAGVPGAFEATLIHIHGVEREQTLVR